MTAGERAERWDARWSLCGDFDREAFADLIAAFRAHANAALEAAAKELEVTADLAEDAGAGEIVLVLREGAAAIRGLHEEG